MSTQLAGKSAVVTGAGSGVGRAIALRLATEGVTVVAVDRSVEGLDATRAAAADTTRVLTVAGDVSDSSTVSAAIRTAAENGTFCYLVAAAGVIDRTPFLESDMDSWRKLLDINLLGYVSFTQAAVRQMQIDGTAGSIVLISSITAHVSSPLVAYSTTKAAIMGFTRSVSPSLAERGIRINTISPGVIRTGINDERLSDPANLAADLQHIPMKRIGVPEDVANTTLFLLSDEASYVTGSDLVVDGAYRHSQV